MCRFHLCNSSESSWCQTFWEQISRVVVLTELDKMHFVKKYLFNLMQVTKVQQVTDGDMS